MIGAPPAPPGEAAVRWAGRELGAPVVAVRRLLGGVEADTHALDLADGRTVVLRQPRLADWDDLARHAAVLEAVSAAGAPAPAPLGVDPAGERAGRPSLLMTLLPGRPCLPGEPEQWWYDGIAGAAAAIHTTPTRALELPDRFARARAAQAEPPPEDMTEPADLELGRLLVELPDAAYVGSRRGLVHLDFWSGNLLWEGERVTGVVDWGRPMLGPPEVDVAEAAMDLWLSRGQAEADRFVASYRSLTGDPLPALPAWLGVSLLHSYEFALWLPGWHELGLDLDFAGVRQRREEMRAAVVPALRG